MDLVQTSAKGTEGTFSWASLVIHFYMLEVSQDNVCNFL